MKKMYSMLNGLKYFLLSMMLLSVSTTLLAVEEKKVDEPKPKPKDNSSDEDVLDLPWRGSIMFKKDKLKFLYATLGNYDAPVMVAQGSDDEELAVPYVPPSDNNNTTKIPVEVRDTTPVVVQKTEVKVNPNGPSFSLNSVLYYNPSNWTIWLNGNRIRHGYNGDDLKVLSVKEDSVEVAWSGVDLNVISPNWNENFIRLGSSSNAIGSYGDINTRRMKRIAAFRRGDFNWDYQSVDGRIYVDSDINAVKFKIDLHQTFVTNNMEIVEGYESSGSPVSIAEGSLGRRGESGDSSGDDLLSILDQY